MLNKNSLEGYIKYQFKHANQRKKVLEIIRKYRAITCEEIAVEMGVVPSSISGRVTELKKMGIIIVGGKTVNKNNIHVDILVPKVGVI